MPFYAVAKGRTIGVFGSWSECEKQVKGDFRGIREQWISGGCKRRCGDTLENLIEYPEPEQLPAKPAPKNNKKLPVITTKPVKIGKYFYDVDNEGFVQVHIAGKCENIGSWNGIAGYGVYFGSTHKLNHFAACTGKPTHNIGDIDAAVYALQKAKEVGIQKLCLITSSEFVLNCVARWLKFWKLHDWRNATGKVVQNRKELTKLDELLNEDNGLAVNWRNRKDIYTPMKVIRELNGLAKMGMEEYLEEHPDKEENSFDYDNYGDMVDYLF